MSRLYEKYKSLKLENSSKLYLFKSGIFYIFLDEDAIRMSKLLNLKLTNLNETIVKCGFPVKNADKYIHLIKLNNYEIDIIDSSNPSAYSNFNYVLNEQIKQFIMDLSEIDYYQLSVSEAFALIEKISNTAKKFFQRTNRKTLTFLLILYFLFGFP